MFGRPRGAAGLEEAGLGEGVTKEFLVELIKTGFSPQEGLFQQGAEGTLFPNPAAHLLVPESIAKFELLGAVLGEPRVGHGEGRLVAHAVAQLHEQHAAAQRAGGRPGLKSTLCRSDGLRSKQADYGEMRTNGICARLAA